MQISGDSATIYQLHSNLGHIDGSTTSVKIFLRVVILAVTAICCTERAIDGTETQPMWQRSGKYQGDIMLSEQETRTGMINPASRWPGRTLTFFIDPVFTAAEVNTIMAGVNQFNTRTTVRLVRATSRPTSGDWVHVTAAASGCWSYVGRIGGELNLQRIVGCVHVGTVIHEFLHALGFYHMQSATERDNWVQILWQNIQPGYEHAFDKYGANIISMFGVPYDYQSVMHYSATAFSANGQPTLRTTNPPGAAIGQRKGFSTTDIQRLDAMY